jgi:cysteine desulfurase family protein (TIGR01976 family)
MSVAECTIATCRESFPSLRRTLSGRPLAFFDGPGGTQVPQPVIAAVSDYYTSCNGGSNGKFITSQESDGLIHETRTALAAFLGARSWREISLGANLTSMAFSLSRAMARELMDGDEIVITQLDHEANRGPWLALTEQGVVVKEVNMLPGGTLDPEDMARKINPRTRLVAIGHSSSALGTVNDLALARKLSGQVGAWLVVDAAHAAPHFSLDVEAMDADFLLCSAGKFYGPQAGVLYCRPGLLNQLRPSRLRTQEAKAPFRFETGAQNHAALAGVLAGLRWLAGLSEGATLRARLRSTMAAVAERERQLANQALEQLRGIAGVSLWGPGPSANRAPTVALTVAGHPAGEVARRLGERGVLVGDGDFHSARAVELLGLEAQGGLVRAGISIYTTAEEVHRLCEGVAAIARG